MNKQFVAAVTSVAVLASSCVSTQKYDTRGIASSQAPAPAVVGAVADIAAQGVQQVDGPAVQEIEALRKGRNFDFSNKQFRVRKFEDSDVQKLASAFNVKVKAGQVMVDNDMAFERKLRVIESANSELRLVYFIYSNDDSSSKLNAALLKKAQSGVEVKLLVDFLTNYKNLDLFIGLNKLSGGKIKPYFYNFPSQQVFADAMYMSLPCSKTDEKTNGDACYQEKMAKIKSMGTPAQLKANPPAMAKILLTGIYAKNPAALKVALGLGAKIDPADFKSDKPKLSEEEGDALLDLAVTFKEAFIDNSIIAKIKLSIAMSMYGDKINPILEQLTGRFPLRSLGEYGSGKDNSHAEVWDHFTDYTHHKLVLADKEQFVLGGRNVEDSYHMKHRVGSAGKYIFMDTDFWGKTDPNGAADMAKAYDAIVKSPMVASLETAKAYLAYDFVANTGVMAPEALGAPKGTSITEVAVGTCLKQGAGEKLGDCILATISKIPGNISEDARVQKVQTDMQSAMANYNSTYKVSPDNAFGTLSPRDLETSSFHYLENTSIKDGKRIPGSKIGFEADHMKRIQAAWYRGLENVCKVSADEKRPMRVLFNTAYLLMPSGLVHRIAQMMNNDFGDCSRVTVTFITNSPFTTDLAPINLLARYQLGALFDHYKSLQQYKQTFESPVKLEGSGDESRYVAVPEGTKGATKFKYKQFWPKLEYYEYTPVSSEQLEAYSSKGTKPNSLHTKTTLLGDDLIIGSANGDIRSYFMDTNNAMMIRNAHEMVAQYGKFIDDLVASGRIVDRMANFQGRSFEALRAENEAYLEAAAKRWKQEKRLEKGYAKTILEYIDKGGQKIYTTTRDLLTYRGKFDNAGVDDIIKGESYKFNEQLNQDANSMDDVFKLF